MYAVRIDKDNEGYVFKVQPALDDSAEMIAMDSTPGIIAIVHAVDPGAAAARAWELGSHMYDEPIEALDGKRLLELLEKP